MARFVLKPCRLRADRFVPTSDPVIELDWQQLLERFWKSGQDAGLRNLAFLRLGGFIGLTKSTNQLRNFILHNDDHSGNIKNILKRDPGFANRVTEVYRIEQIDKGSRIVEVT